MTLVRLPKRVDTLDRLFTPTPRRQIVVNETIHYHPTPDNQTDYLDLRGVELVAGPGMKPDDYLLVVHFGRETQKKGRPASHYTKRDVVLEHLAIDCRYRCRGVKFMADRSVVEDLQIRRALGTALATDGCRETVCRDVILKEGIAHPDHPDEPTLDIQSETQVRGDIPNVLTFENCSVYYEGKKIRVRVKTQAGNANNAPVRKVSFVRCQWHDWQTTENDDKPEEAFPVKGVDPRCEPPEGAVFFEVERAAEVVLDNCNLRIPDREDCSAIKIGPGVTNCVAVDTRVFGRGASVFHPESLRKGFTLVRPAIVGPIRGPDE